MSNFVDLTGKKFDRLTVLKLHHKKQGYSKNGTKNGSRYYYECLCDCGNKIIVRSDHLKRYLVRSCGCFALESKIKCNTTHGQSKTRLYSIWECMKRRCYEIKNNRYKYYGGKGITVCQDWLDFENFYNWSINNGYKKNLTIDRINVNGNYEPQNCRWVTAKIQARNTSQNRFFTYNGETHCIAEWAEITGINYYKLYARLIRRKWSIDKALTESLQCTRNQCNQTETSP